MSYDFNRQQQKSEKDKFLKQRDDILKTPDQFYGTEAYRQLTQMKCDSEQLLIKNIQRVTESSDR
jgi:hypothetical protein